MKGGALLEHPPPTPFSYSLGPSSRDDETEWGLVGLPYFDEMVEGSGWVESERGQRVAGLAGGIE